LVVDICTSAKTQSSNKTELQTPNISKNKRDILTTMKDRVAAQAEKHAVQLYPAFHTAGCEVNSAV
jgi:hypothetical protein